MGSEERITRQQGTSKSQRNQEHTGQSWLSLSSALADRTLEVLRGTAEGTLTFNLPGGEGYTEFST